MPPSLHDEMISVVMPVYNAAPYLDEAVGSILGQSHANFEFIIFDDGSTDGSREQLERWARRDSRIRLHRSDSNLGPVASSNIAASRATGSLVARMDADDVSHPDRLCRQIDVLNDSPDAGLVGSLCYVIDEEGRIVRGPDRWRLRHSGWHAPFPHGSIMYRRDLFEQVGGYREQCAYWEDLDLFLRMASLTKVLTIAEPQYRHRHSHGSSRLDPRKVERIEAATDLAYRCIAALDGGSDYEGLLASQWPGASHRVDPRVFRARGSITLWAGGRPQLVGRLLRHGRLRVDLRTLFALVWTSLAAISPATLRSLLKSLAAARNTASRRDEQVVEWELPQKVRVMRSNATADEAAMPIRS